MFECISMLSMAAGQTLSKYMESLLDPIFACGLSPSLTQALVDMAHYIPPIKPTIQEKLLDMLSMVLYGTPFKPLGCPDNKQAPAPFAKESGSQPQERNDTEVALALHTLGSFDFAGTFCTALLTLLRRLTPIIRPHTQRIRSRCRNYFC